MKPCVVYKKFVMFGDLNPIKVLYGGTMLKWIDEAASIFAAEQLGKGKHFSTIKVSEILFKHPARLGDLLTFSAQFNRVGRTSFGVSVFVCNREREIVSCDVTFVALDDEGRPIRHGLPPLEGDSLHTSP